MDAEIQECLQTLEQVCTLLGPCRFEKVSSYAFPIKNPKILKFVQVFVQSHS